MNGSKQCKVCAQVLPLLEFYSKHCKSNPDQRRAECRSCFNKAQRENPVRQEKLRIASREWKLRKAAENPDTPMLTFWWFKSIDERPATRLSLQELLPDDAPDFRDLITI